MQDNYLIRKYALSSYRYTYMLCAENYQVLLAYLPGLEQLIRQTGHWDKLGFRAFLEYLGDAYQEHFSKEEYESFIKRSYEETLEIGSAVYTKMFLTSSYTAEEKIDLVLKQLGAWIDEYRMLQLTGDHQIAPEMAPHDRFLHIFSQIVQKAYNTKVLDSLEVHQLRMYIDRQNIQYIRHKFKLPGLKDEEALNLYVKTAKEKGGLGGKKLIAERGRYHNKYKYGEARTQFNRKRLAPNFHSEFILNETGDFVSPWNVLHEDEQGVVISDWSYYQENYQENLLMFEEQIMNGESFNYAHSNGKVHRQLDVYPSRYYDYTMRNEIAKNWSSPELSEYHWRKVDTDKSRYHRKGL